jgi:hypothetical protein
LSNHDAVSINNWAARAVNLYKTLPIYAPQYPNRLDSHATCCAYDSSATPAAVATFGIAFA